MERPAFELSSVQDHDLGHKMARFHNRSCASKKGAFNRHCEFNFNFFSLCLCKSAIWWAHNESLQRFEEKGMGQGYFIFHNQKMALKIQNWEKRNTDKPNGCPQHLKQEHCSCCGQTPQGRPTQLYTRSKCKASSFVWKSAGNSSQSFTFGSRPQTGYLISWSVNKNVNV